MFKMKFGSAVGNCQGFYLGKFEFFLMRRQIIEEEKLS